MLAKLEIARDVFRIGFQEFLEVGGGGVVVAELHAFQREAVARKCVSGFFGDKLFQDFAARLLCLGHSVKTRIIAGLRAQAKSAPFASEFCRVRGSNGANVQEHQEQEAAQKSGGKDAEWDRDCDFAGFAAAGKTCKRFHFRDRGNRAAERREFAGEYARWA